MIASEALKEMQKQVYRNTDNCNMTISKDCYKAVISALEKQIVKKPVVDRYPWAICPICGGSVYLQNIQEHIYNDEKTYCEHCGQALDWSDGE